MPAISITFQSNLTASASGSTITSATTSRQRSTPDATALNLTSVTQSIATSATSIDLGAVDVTKSYALRFRNLETYEAATPTNQLVTVLCTVGGSDRIVGYLRQQSTFGPIDVPGSGLANAPTGWKLQSSGAAAVVEVMVAQASDVTT